MYYIYSMLVMNEVIDRFSCDILLLESKEFLKCQTFSQNEYTLFKYFRYTLYIWIDAAGES